MSSFLISNDQRETVHDALRSTLDAIDSHRDRFAAVEARLRTAAQHVTAAGVLPPSPRLLVGTASAFRCGSTVEALSYVTRHSDEPDSVDNETTRRLFDEPLPDRITPSQLAHWHRELSAPTTAHRGTWKTRENIMPDRAADGVWRGQAETTAPEDVEPELHLLHERYETTRRDPQWSPVVTIAAYALDLFKVHPFEDGNGRTARFAIERLLLREGHDVVRLAGVEQAAARRRWDYLQALRRAHSTWREGDIELLGWSRFVADSVLWLYESSDARAWRLEAWAQQIDLLEATRRELPAEARDDAGRLLQAEPRLDEQKLPLLMRAAPPNGGTAV